MSAKVNIFYPHLLQITNNQKEVAVNGATVGECLDDLVRQFPEIYKFIFVEPGKMLNFINILVNGDSVLTYSPNPLAKPIQDGDSIDIALMLAGG